MGNDSQQYLNKTVSSEVQMYEQSLGWTSVNWPESAVLEHGMSLKHLENSPGEQHLRVLHSG